MSADDLKEKGQFGTRGYSAVIVVRRALAEDCIMSDRGRDGWPHFGGLAGSIHGKRWKKNCELTPGTVVVNVECCCCDVLCS